MTQISTDTFIKQTRLGELETKRHWVYARILKGEADIHTIVQDLNFPIQTVSGRISELLDQGIISQTEEGKFYPTNIGMVESSKMGRQWDKFKKWKSLGEKMGYFGLMETK